MKHTMLIILYNTKEQNILFLPTTMHHYVAKLTKNNQPNLILVHEKTFFRIG